MANLHSAVLADFTPVRVSKPVPQRITLELAAFGFAKAYCLNNDICDKEGFRRVHREVKEKLDKYALSPSHIKRRQLVFFPRLTDIRFSDGEFTLAEPEYEYLQLFKDKNDPKGVDLKARHESYGKVVDGCLNQMYDDGAKAPDDVIHVTCSGYLAPSPVERMVARKEWFDTTVTHSYHMGCYGAFPAIKMAHGFLSSSQCLVTPPKERVDIIHTELLSIHNNIEDFRAENIITMTLFADGFIRYSMYPEPVARERKIPGLKVLAFNEHLLPDSAEDMTWVPGSHQFHMTLSVMVPVVLKKHIRSFVQSLLRRVEIDFDAQKDELTFAIHPGGPKIVEHIQDELGLREDQVEVSKEVFRENGNMSSATVPHILKTILDDKSIPRGRRVVCLGFGPGLTITGLVLEKV
ncbi:MULTISPECIES: type III polyketide synthase [Methylocaldum]|uniref:type III polyketide synthase n=1 Tax=unclassified Methylocaldum TaxID=2622260 RepID=UPI000989A899|nr:MULTISPECIES: type III polyketide synthase [unclassified Methylocaldum]MBP1148191.1 putative naringenin-chalcone synthase [Methylocaldum sp. RMAD-M]MVF21762.1 type III polyketide synthase [Methylocaldum sp. BRCS4]